jgi:hypothetical protein
VAFRNPDETIVLVAVNTGETQDYVIRWDGRHVVANLPKQSLSTLRWKPTGKPDSVFLPLVYRSPNPPLPFQDFEPDGRNCRDLYIKSRVECMREGGDPDRPGTHLKCMAGDDPPSEAPHGGTVGIYYHTCGPVDLSNPPVTHPCTWVKDSRGSNTVELRLVDDDGCLSRAAWSTKRSMQGVWTKICWKLDRQELTLFDPGPLPDCTTLDRNRIAGIEIYEWNDGVYRFDDIHLVPR